MDAKMDTKTVDCNASCWTLIVHHAVFSQGEWNFDRRYWTSLNVLLVPPTGIEPVSHA